MKVSVIIPNFNGESLLAKNLPYVVRAMDNKENCILEIIVVDDASADGSIKLLKDKFPQVKIIKHKINRGFSAAVNTGVRGSGGELLALLNLDVVPNEDFMVNTLPHFKDSKIFAVSLHERGYGWARGGFNDGYIQILPGDEGELFHESFYASGGSGVFRRSTWMELGGMDEELLSPFYWEDIDLCFRAAKRGYIVGWEPGSGVVHNHESTISKLSKNYVARIKERNQLLCLWKNITSQNLVRKHIAGIFLRIARHPGYLRVVLLALGRLPVALKKKRKEIKESKVSDEAIFGRFS
jgi:GT2 family glycosyltransferase